MSNLLEFNCNSGTYSDLDIASLSRLRKINVENSSSLASKINIANMPALTELNIGLT
jgi:hypothetical protein